MWSKRNIFQYLKGFLIFLFLLLLIFYLVSKVVFQDDMSSLWIRHIIFSILLAAIYSFHYRLNTIEEKVDNFDSLIDRILDEKWIIVDEGENTLLLKPKFDHFYNFISRDRIKIYYSDNIATIEGPNSYIERFSKDIRGESNLWVRRLSGFAFLVFLLIILVLPAFRESKFGWDIKINYHNSRSQNTEFIEMQDTRGNTIENINNYGQGDESEEYFFFVTDHLNLIRTDKDFQESVSLINKSSGDSISYLNVVDDWIYYRDGKNLNRMKFDGSNRRTLARMSYLTDINIVQDGIYSINYFDRSSIYKMDINGQDLERFLKIDAADIAVFEDRLFFSHEKDGKGYVESISHSGDDRRIELETLAYDLTIHDGYYYFINENYKLIRSEIDSDVEFEVLVDDKVSSYIITNMGIFYSLHSKDAGYPGEDVYKIQLDGSEETLVLETELIEGFALVGSYLLFHSSDEPYAPTLKRLNLETDEIVEINLRDL